VRAEAHVRFLKWVLGKALKRRFYHVVFAGINDMGGDKGEDFSVRSSDHSFATLGLVHDRAPTKASSRKRATKRTSPERGPGDSAAGDEGLEVFHRVEGRGLPSLGLELHVLVRS